MTIFTNLHKQRVLVTGGAGFIGSHLVERLLAHGAQVTILDNLSTGSLDNLTFDHSRISFLEGDITDEQTCLQAARNQQYIFHLAAQASVALTEQHPSACYATNVLGTAHMLEAARRAGCARFVFSSSAAVYGNQSHTCVEDMALNACSTYGMSKQMGEELCAFYRTNYGLHTISLRYFNVYGPRQKNGGIYTAINQALEKNQPLALEGDGTQTRDFVSVDTIVQANLLAALAPESILAAPVLNIATGKSISLLTLFQELKKNYPDYSYPLSFRPARVGDIKHSRADCSKFMALKHQLTS